MKFEQPRIFYYLAGLLFLLNCVQAFFTDLIYDEAYYWHYAQELSWGYFDHPPMVAFMIWLSSYFVEGELGVRLLSCLLSVGTIFVLWRLVDDQEKKKHIPLFFILVFSMPLINAYGFFTLPDTPLLFFTALFLLAYKNFLEQENLLWSVILGMTIAMLMYSKYHAALIVLFVFFSNLKLIANKYAWLALFVGILIYSPHLKWLYDHQFVSIKYHLFDRPNRAYEFVDFTLGFFINLVVLFGLTFPWIYKALFKTKTKDLFTKSLLFLVFGFIIFFLISSLNRRVQTQWLIAICIPMILIVYNFILNDKITRKWIFRTGMANIAILLYLRIGLAYAPLFPVHYESHNNEEWAQRILSEAGDIPVVFENSYRRASMYAFYTGNPTYSLNNLWFRRNQYSIDKTESRVQHKDVLYVSKFLPDSDFDILLPSGSYVKSVYMSNFESFRKLECVVDPKARTSDPDEWVFKLINPYDIDIDLSKLKFGLAYLNQYKQVKADEAIEVKLMSKETDRIGAKDTLNLAFSLPGTEMESPAYFKLCISENDLRYGLNGNIIKLPRE